MSDEPRERPEDLGRDAPSWSRRRVLGLGGRLAALGIAPLTAGTALGDALARPARSGGGRPVASGPDPDLDPRRGRPLPPWPLDADGDGRIDDADRNLVARAPRATRGFGLEPARGYDFRADLLGRGVVDDLDLRLLERERRRLPEGVPPAPRPIVMCWHYGWYTERRRFGEATSVSYLGGPYLSDDPDVERRFHALKDEFGITVDMLSWIDEEPVLRSWERGYLATVAGSGRRFGWLYETAINLGSNGPMDLSAEAPFAARLVRNFRDMARMSIDRETGELLPGIFRIDGRPVVFLFASHLLGNSTGNLVHVARALERARQTFAKVAGVTPWLIGDEALFPSDPGRDDGRGFRATFFDAISRYHHYDADVVARLGGGRALRAPGDYLETVVANERRTMEAFSGLHNRFTGAPVLVIPSSAAGFAKLGLPTLLAGHDDYLEILDAFRTLTDEHLAAEHPGRIGTPALPAPLVIAGSWNEEFEGHSLFPAAFSAALEPVRQGGFDWLFALKATYGWNHYRNRRLPGEPA